MLMTTDTVGGVWTFTMELAGALQKHGVEVWLAALGGAAEEWQRRQAAGITGVRLFESKFQLEWMDDPWEDVYESGKWLLELAKEWRPDIVHLNSFGHAALSWPTPVVLTAHSCVVSWWRAVNGGDVPPVWGRYRREVARALGSAQAVTTPSQAMANALEECYGFNARETRVIPNGRTASMFFVKPKEPMLLAAGRLWDHGKNIAQIARVACDLPWPVYVAGAQCDGNGRSEAPAGCHALGPLSPDALAEWYARASIYVLPALYEPFGYSALEAALSGCALVLGDIPSLREIWNDAALFVPPDDAGKLARTLGELIADPGRRQQMALRAGGRALAFTPSRMAEAYLDVYSNAAAGRMACAS
jgi:glycosyltransferase involved in cell wall biosynthesis